MLTSMSNGNATLPLLVLITCNECLSMLLASTNSRLKILENKFTTGDRSVDVSLYYQLHIFLLPNMFYNHGKTEYVQPIL